MEEINNPTSYMFYHLNLLGDADHQVPVSPSFVSEVKFASTNYSAAIDLKLIPSKRWRDIENYKKDRDKLIEKYNGELGNH